MARYIPVAETAKLVRAALKAEFPTVTFGVRSKSYSGGASINIRWTDGPTEAMVDRLVARFKGATFDGMIDLESPVDGDLDGERVHFGAHYIFTARAHGAALTAHVAGLLARRWGVPVEVFADHRARVEPAGDEYATTLHDREARELAVTPAGEYVRVHLRYR